MVTSTLLRCNGDYYTFKARTSCKLYIFIRFLLFLWILTHAARLKNNTANVLAKGWFPFTATVVQQFTTVLQQLSCNTLQHFATPWFPIVATVVQHSTTCITIEQLQQHYRQSLACPNFCNQLHDGLRPATLPVHNRIVLPQLPIVLHFTTLATKWEPGLIIDD